MEIKIGQRFKTTFKGSNIKGFEVVGINDEKGLALTKVYPNEGHPFDDSIEIETLQNALDIGEYKFLFNRYEEITPEAVQTFSIRNPYHDWLMPQPHKEARCKCNMCGRCKNRFGGSSKQRNYCEQHCNDDTCPRFKLDM